MSRKSERRVGVLRCGAVLLAGLLAVSLLSGCGDGGVKQGSSAVAMSSSSSSAAVASSAASSSASESASATNSSPTSSSAGSGVASSATASATSAAPTSATTAASSSAEPTATTTTNAGGAVTEHMDASRMPPKPAPPLRVELPPAAYTQTKTGAMVAAIGFFKELEYLQATGDNQYFQSTAALDTCTECKRLSDGAVSAYKGGRYALVQPNVLSNLVVESFEKDLARVSMDLVMPGPVRYFPKLNSVSRFAEYRGAAVVDVQWLDGRWIVTNFEGVQE